MVDIEREETAVTAPTVNAARPSSDRVRAPWESRPGAGPAAARPSAAVLRPELAAAAGFLGLPEHELRRRLETGATLRQLARERDRPLARLVQTMVEIGRARLQAAALAGQLTQLQVEELAADLRRRIERSAATAIPFPPAAAIG